jgi:Protein of unknown function (DUF998)
MFDPSAAQQLAPLAGMTGSALFVAVFILEDLLRPDFNWLSTAASEHSIGPYGWIQIATFVVTGLLFLAFARGAAREFRDGNGATLGPRFLVILGWCILLSGPFVADPAPLTMFSREATWHGTVHGIVGAIGFTFMPLSCFVFYRRFRKNPHWRPLASWTLAACIVIILAIALLKVAQLEPLRGLIGLFQRMVLVTYFGWTFAFAARLGRIPKTSAIS